MGANYKGQILSYKMVDADRPPSGFHVGFSRRGCVDVFFRGILAQTSSSRTSRHALVMLHTDKTQEAAAQNKRQIADDGEGSGPNKKARIKVKEAEGPKVRFDQPGPGKFSVVYLEQPDANFASLNAGDYDLYVGGGAINKAFCVALEACGQKPNGKFQELHKALLKKAGASPGELQWVGSEDVDAWALEDCIGCCGLLPAANRFQQLSPVGLVSITVFPEGRRPMKSDRNVAMMYAVGPNCGDTLKEGRRDVDDMTKAQFLEVLKEVGAAMASAIRQYNEAAVAGPTLAAPAGVMLPRIDVLRVCLLSGGVYKHTDASKVEVASALIQGLVACGAGPAMPLLDFAFDEDCFQKAWKMEAVRAHESEILSAPNNIGHAGD